MPRRKITQAKKYIPAKASSEYKAFFDRFFQDVPDGDIALMSPASIAQTIDSHWRMLQGVSPDKPAVRVYTPKPGKTDKRLPHTVIDIVSDDMAFLVDSVAAEIGRYNRLIHVLLHPVLHFERAKNGKVSGALAREKSDGFAFSHMHIELSSAVPDVLAAKLEQDLIRILRDVRFATRDWLVMKEKLRSCQQNLKKAPKKYSNEDIQEYLNFLEYLYMDNFTLLGFREYKFTEKGKDVKSQTVKSSSLGLLADEVQPVYINEKKQGLSQELQRKRYSLPPVAVAKINKKSTVHRAVPLDAIAVKQFDDKGRVTGESLFIGLFTSVTYSRSIQDIPYLRVKAERVMALSGFEIGSHDYKALRHILEKYPRDELFQIEAEDLLEKSLDILRLQERPRIALYTRPDRFGRYVSCLIYVPRDRYDTHLRKSINAILEEELQGTCADFYTTLDDSPLARVVCIIYVDQSSPPKYDADIIEARLQAVGRTWGETLVDALQELRKDDDTVLSVIQKYGEAFPSSYQAEYSGTQAIYDIDKIEDVLATGRMALDLYQTDFCDRSCMRLKLYHPDMPITLSDILPILENMGLRVMSEWPFEIRPNGGDKRVWIHDFEIDLGENHRPVDVETVKDVFEEMLAKIWYGLAANDHLNQLVFEAGMDWRKIVVLRAYTKFLRQAGYPFGARFIETTLVTYSDIASHLVDLFNILHDPKDQNATTEQRVSACIASIESAMEAVNSLDEDRVLHSLLALVEATLRTNFFQQSAQGDIKPYLSLKLDSRKIDDLPQPRPYREIFVYSPDVEGVHLRGDKIARGGIRWSDRQEDFRTEILGLMKAQQVKNSLIVPMGAKGGFVVKNPPASGDRKEIYDQGVLCYKDFIRGLLDITDNRKGAKVVPPKNVVRRDGDDPYLVVAADKGTASFSDIANGLSAEYGFWLGDAFASGGSAGYDHKVMGITARGAWESVKRHFREMNHDTQSQPFDVVGVGDMGGDVFGNGMLLSRQIRLVGAFNHMHIFCDPNPDPEISFKERQRLFKAVKGWDGYDEKKLSKGGRIYSRKDKRLELTPEIRDRFGLKSDKVSPIELIRAMLTARTDLLWFGGIGTYIKATSETHLDVGDKSNDALRVNASEIKARVIGEGANLAITQRGRIEFSKNGGWINADFIDNSGGVDSSDHEVNIKILLADVMDNPAYKMDRAKRDKLLEKMTDEVADLVLRNNYQQTQAISLMGVNGHKKLPNYIKFIHHMEKTYGLNRDLEALPNDEEFEKRRQEGRGLNRPELSIVQAYAKIFLTKELLATDIPDQEILNDRLFNYFPEPLREKYKQEISAHRLKREIIATSTAVSIVNRMGPVFVEQQKEKTGVDSAEVVRAYLLVQEAFELCDLWQKLESLDNRIPAQVQLKAMHEMFKLARRETRWLLNRFEQNHHLSEDVSILKSGIYKLRKNIHSVVTDHHRQTIEQFSRAYIADNVPEDLANHLALLPVLATSFDIICAAMDHDTDIVLAAHVYFQLGELLYIDWLRRQARYLTADNRWSLEASTGLLEQLDACQAGLTVRVLQDMKGQISGMPKKNIVKKWIEQNKTVVQKTGDLFADMRVRNVTDLSMLVIAEQRLRSLYGF